MSLKKHALTFTTAIIAAWLTVHYLSFGPNTNKTENGLDIYKRVMAKGAIDCGYFVEPPFTKRDETTGKLSGLTVDLMDKIGKELGLKVNWTFEINFATLTEELNEGKYDMLCGDLFILPRAGRMDYTTPFGYVSVHGYVTPENKRFDQAFDTIAWDNVTIAGLDGEGATTAVQKRLPHAKLNVLPSVSTIGEMLLSVVQKKSDIAFVLPSVFADFNHNNPGILRQAKLGRPLQTYAIGFGLPRQQDEFKNMIDNVLLYLNVSGELAALFKKHDPQGFFQYPVVDSQ